MKGAWSSHAIFTFLQKYYHRKWYKFHSRALCIDITNSSNANNKIVIIMITSDKDLRWLPSLLSCNFPQIQTGLYFKLCHV